MTFIDLLLEKKLSVYRVSQLSGVPKTTIHDISIGKSDILNCNGKTLLAIASTLNVSIEYLLSLEPEMYIPKLPGFLVKSLNLYKNAVRKGSLSLDCCIDELNSSVNVAEVEGFITKEIADKIEREYRESL